MNRVTEIFRTVSGGLTHAVKVPEGEEREGKASKIF